MNLSLNIAIFLFFIYILNDGLYAFYTRSIADRKPVLAATSGSLMHFVIAYGVISYVQNYWYVLPIALGSWVGTFVVSYFHKHTTP